jgi:ribulose-5-phosphate 4-epimerase/fuculose-1-phosphate aldolase
MSAAKEQLSVRSQVSEEEWNIRVNLAACYRLIAMYGWDDLIFTHISARVPGPDEHFLINAYGMMFEEMAASSLVKVNLDGEVVLDTPHFINPAGFTIHSAIHAARADAGCVLHTHTRAGVAVSAQAEGLLPLSQISLLPYASLAYHDYEGIALNEEEKPRLVADLGDRNFLILRNHGLLTVGPTIPDAFLFMYALETACQIQLGAMSGGGTLTRINSVIVDGIQEQIDAVLKGVGAELAWPGLLRKLDRRDSSYRD